MLFTDHVGLANEQVLRRVEMERKLLKMVKKRQLKFLGHTVRKDGLEHLRGKGESRTSCWGDA